MQATISPCGERQSATERNLRGRAGFSSRNERSWLSTLAGSRPDLSAIN
jgi:hypothetical protein